MYRLLLVFLGLVLVTPSVVGQLPPHWYCTAKENADGTKCVVDVNNCGPLSLNKCKKPNHHYQFSSLTWKNLTHKNVKLISLFTISKKAEFFGIQITSMRGQN